MRARLWYSPGKRFFGRVLENDDMSWLARLRIVGVFGIFLFAAAVGRGDADDVERPFSENGRVIELFNGKDLSGWTTSSGEPVTDGWAVEDGELVRTSRGGAIYADGEYEDFILDFEWKIAPGVNSGLKYRVQFYEKGVYGNPGWLGCEYQIYDEAKNPPAEGSTGALYDIYPPNDKKQVNPPGEYNHSRIVVSGNRIEHWLNGERIVAADTSSDEWKERIADSKFAPVEGFGQNRRGRIQVQDHGGKISFKRITLRPLRSKDLAEK